MSWQALRHDPAPGDEGQVLALADRLRAVSRNAENLVTGLRSVDGGTGAEVWSGQAADAFRGVLSDAGPAVYRLNTAYMQADQALRRYADELGEAQRVARTAEADGERALADQSRARADEARADADARTAWLDAAAAQARWVAGQAERLLAPTDPVFQAQMQSYLTNVAAERDRAHAQEANAKRRSAAAGAALDDADRRLAGARARGEQAGRDRTDAVWRVVDELRAAQPPGRNWDVISGIAKLVDDLTDTAKDIVEGFADYGVQEYKDGKLRWQKELGFLWKDFGLTAKQIDKLATRLEAFDQKVVDLTGKISKGAGKAIEKIKVLGVVSIGLDTLDAARDQRAEDMARRPTLSDTERLFREIGAAVAVGALSTAEVLGADALTDIGVVVGTFFGAAPGAVIGGLLGMALSTAINVGIDRRGGDDAIREWGASFGSRLYRQLLDVAGDGADAALLNGSADTSGSVWKAMVA